MDENEELSSLEKVRERLYDPNAAAPFREPALSERPVERARGWERVKVLQKEAEHISGPARFFIVALGFFLLTAGGATFYLLYGGRIVSTNNVNIAVQGPTTIASGDSVPLLITIENRNPVAIQHATLTIDFPEGTKSADDVSQPYSTYREDLGTIDSGGKEQRTVRAVIFGSEGQHIALPVKLEYKTGNSNSVFVKHKQYDFTITTSPLSLDVSSVSQVSSGQSVTVDVTVRSNATTPLNAVAVSAEYPFGFTLTSANPQPSTGSVFSFGTLNPGEQRHITLIGVVSGENNDERVFKFSAGTLTDPASNTFAATYTSKDATIKLTKPFLATSISVNHDTSDAPVVDAGVPVQVTVSWTNTLAAPVSNARVTVALSGNALDPSAVVAGNGFYSSSDRTVIFDPSTNPALANLQPGDTGQGTFTFTAKRSALSLGAPTVVMRVSVAGQRLSEANVPETISSTLTRTVKVGTSLTLNSRIVHTTGPFANTGPWPPEVNQPTTYTVVYTLNNSGNDVAAATVSAALPPYVTFTGATSGTGSVSYNEATRTVTWSAGDVSSGSNKSAAFQISFIPSVSQQGTSPVLLSAQQVTAVDRFTQRTISGSVRELTTQTSSDPAYSAEDGNVK
ncbi:MAG: hypothetical protein ACM3TU_03395 [Bacillota bacterium]